MGPDPAVAAPVGAHPSTSTSAPRSRSPASHAVLTAATCPGRNRYGLEHRDQPVFADDVVRYAGEPVAVVAADHPETARRACAAIVVRLRRARAAHRSRGRARRAADRTPTATSFRELVIRRGDPDAPRARSSSRARTRSACRTRRSWVPRPGSRSPPTTAASTSIVSTQWLHNDREQVAECLGLPEEKVRLTLGGVGGAFGAREDVSLHIHVVPARAAHRPAGEDGVLPRGVVPRSRAPPPGPHLDAPHARNPTARS